MAQDSPWWAFVGTGNFLVAQRCRLSALYLHRHLAWETPFTYMVEGG